jgi:hypothetical protein
MTKKQQEEMLRAFRETVLNLQGLVEDAERILKRAEERLAQLELEIEDRAEQ